jgi:hypothetical protein
MGPTAGSGQGKPTRRGVSQGTLFELHVGMQIELRRFSRFVTEPEGDHAEVDAVTAPWPRRGAACGASRASWQATDTRAVPWRHVGRRTAGTHRL